MASSAWTGSAEEMPVDEVETVRIVSGESPGAITLLKRERGNPISNDWHKTLSVSILRVLTGEVCLTQACQFRFCKNRYRSPSFGGKVVKMQGARKGLPYMFMTPSM